MVFHKLNNVWLLFEINSFLIKVTIEIFMGTHLFGSPCAKCTVLYSEKITEIKTDSSAGSSTAIYSCRERIEWKELPTKATVLKRTAWNISFAGRNNASVPWHLCQTCTRNIREHTTLNTNRPRNLLYVSGSQFILKPAPRPEGKIIFAPFGVLFFVLSEECAPQEVPSLLAPPTENRSCK